MTLKFNIKPAAQQETAQSIAPVQEHKPAFKSKEQTEEQKLVDELVFLDLKMRSLDVDAMIDRKEELRKQLLALVGDADPNEPVVIKGTDGNTVQFSAAKKDMELNKEALIQQLGGVEKYAEIAKVTVTDAKKYLSPAELEKVSTKKFGSRSLKAIIAGDA